MSIPPYIRRGDTVGVARYFHQREYFDAVGRFSSTSNGEK